MDTEQLTEAVVDRFEGGLAVLVADTGNEVVCSRTLLPSGAAEGDVLRLSLMIDRSKTQARVREVQRLIKDK